MVGRTSVFTGLYFRTILEPFEKAVDLLLDVRRDAKGKKDWATSDFIRDRLGEIGFEIKDTKEGTEWKLK